MVLTLVRAVGQAEGANLADDPIGAVVASMPPSYDCPDGGVWAFVCASVDIVIEGNLLLY